MPLWEGNQAGSKPAIFLALLCLGAVIATVVLQRRDDQAQRRIRKGATWFDLDQTSPEAAPIPPSRYTPVPPRSSVELVKTERGFEKPKSGDEAAPAPAKEPAATPAPDAAKKAAEGTFTELCRGSEAKIEALARDYTARFPVIAQYGREWMGYPDLKKLNDDYVRDHDPVRFLRGLAGSKNFAAMVQKYAVQPPVQAFIMDSIKQTPPAATASAMDFVGKEEVGKTFMDRFAQTIGLPPAMLGANAAQSMDQKAILDWVAKNNPDVQKAMSQLPPDQQPGHGGKD